MTVITPQTVVDAFDVTSSDERLNTRVVALPDGTFMVFYAADRAEDGEKELLAQLFDGAGRPLAGEFVVGLEGPIDTSRFDVVAFEDGGQIRLAIVIDNFNGIDFRGFVVDLNGTDTNVRVFETADRKMFDVAIGNAEGLEFDAFLARATSGDNLSTAGPGPLNVEFDLNFGGNDSAVEADVLANGNTVVIADENLRGADREILIFILDETVEDQVAFEASFVSDQGRTIDPVVAALTGGGFVIAATEFVEDENGDQTGETQILLQLFNDDATPNGAPDRIAIVGSTDNLEPTLVALPDGGFFLIFSTDTQIVGQLFTSTGVSVSAPVILTEEPGDRITASLLENGLIAVSFEVPGGEIETAKTLLVSPFGGDLLIGTEGNNSLAGSFFDDVILGEAGDDTVGGSDGDDVIEGGAGADLLAGGDGRDRAEYRSSDEGVTVNLTQEIGLRGHAEGDTLFNIEDLVGSDHNDSLIGDGEDNLLDGADGDDRLVGFDGDDNLVGALGNDELFGGFGDDTINGGFGDERAAGGNGQDQLFGGEGDDFLNGNNDDDLIEGGEGDDELFGAGGEDVVRGGDGNDTVNGGNRNDILTGGEGNDVLFGGNGNDDVFGNNGDDELRGGNGQDLLDGGAGEDFLNGGVGGDQLFGGGDDDTLAGADGGDTLNGGRGNDTLIGGNQADTFQFTGDNFGDDRVSDFGQGDVLDISDLFLFGFDELTIDQVGNNAVLTFDEGTVTLANTQATDLSADDFLFSVDI